MQLIVVSIFDAKAGAFNRPLFLRSDGEAIRSFSAAVSEEGSDFARFAEDYSLMRLGTWDDVTGEFTPETAPVCLVTALVLKAAATVAAAPIPKLKEGN